MFMRDLHGDKNHYMAQQLIVKLYIIACLSGYQWDLQKHSGILLVKSSLNSNIELIKK